MQTIETCKVYSGQSCDKFESIILPSYLSRPLFYTKNGDPGAYVEVATSKFHQKSSEINQIKILVHINS